MSLLLHRAPRADLLAAGLSDLLATPLPDPFAQELVIVPAKGVERWLSQQLSHRLGRSTGRSSGRSPGRATGRSDGVCAGVRFRSPGSLVAEITDTRDRDPWAPDALVWPLLRVIDDHAGEDWCRALSQHLGHEQSGEEGELRRGRRYATARRLAGLFASYAAQRPVLLADWEAGGHSDGTGAALPPDLSWQPPLWRHLVQRMGVPSPGQRHQAILETLREAPDSVGLPERFSLFGHTRIPVTEIELLRALALHRDVHLWVPHPSPALWDANSASAHVDAGAVPRDEDDSHDLARHPLLASLGRDVRELQRSLGPTSSSMIASPPLPDSLLGWLQTDLGDNVVGDHPERTLRVSGDGRLEDDSVQVHACHGAARQVEVLREVLLGLLADDPDLEPRDIVVMCPDVEAYAPLIAASFGMGGVLEPLSEATEHHPGHRLRVMLADRSLVQTNPLLAVMEHLLDLASGRAEASRVLDLLASEPVRRRFGFTEDDLERLGTWVEESGVRWAFDAAQRAPYGLEGVVQNTWRFGLDRILLGVAVSDDADRFFGTTLPLDDVGSGSIHLAGRLAELVDRLQRAAERLQGERPLEDWAEALLEAVDSLTAVDRDEEWQSAQLHRELGNLAESARAARGRPGGAGTADAAWAPSGDTLLRLSDIRALTSRRLAGRPTRANFRTGTLTVCTMTPMRSVPHRVVCLLGLDDGLFPRATPVDGDDVLARRPLTGERDPRSEDRQLLLDAIMSAEDHLVVTYTGVSETTGQDRPPSVPLQELLDALDETVAGAAEAVTRQHTLQAFDPLNFRPEQPFSFDSQARDGARAASGERVAAERIGAEPLPSRADDVDLTDLVAFFAHPVRQFLRQRLDVTLPMREEETNDAIPVDLDALQQWQVGDRLVRELLDGRSAEAVRGREWRRGVLPPGQLGWRLLTRLLTEAEPIAEAAHAFRGGFGGEAVDVQVELGPGRMLSGTVSDIYGDRLVRATYSRIGPRHWLEAWIPLVVLGVAHPARAWTAGFVGRGEQGATEPARVSWAGVPDAAERLADLVRIYDAGMLEPLPLPLKTGFAWAEQHQRSESRRRWKAAQKWESARYDGEDRDPAHLAVWGAGITLDALLDQAPLPDEEHDGETTRLGALAARLWRPMWAGVHR